MRPYADDDLGEVLDAWYLAALAAHSFLSEDFFDSEVFEANTIGRRFYDAYGFRVLSEDFESETGLPALRLRIDCSPT